MLNFWIIIVLDVVGCGTVGLFIARTVRMAQSQLARFFFGSNRGWPMYVAIYLAAHAWADALVAFGKGHWGWHAFHIAMMLFVFSYLLYLRARARRDHAERIPNSG